MQPATPDMPAKNTLVMHGTGHISSRLLHQHIPVQGGVSA